MKRLHLPALWLAALLQLFPLVRQVFTLPSAGSSFAIIFRWAAGAGVALGSVDAVSGASNFRFTCSNGATGYVGQPFSFLISVTNYGSDSGATIACTPVPPGLSNYFVDKVTTNPKQLYGMLTGTPTTATTNLKVTVIAGHQCCSSVSTNIYLTFRPGSPPMPPQITNHPPPSQSVMAGGTASFSVVAGGAAPLFYQWRRAGTNLPGATGSSLSWNGVRLAQAGTYTVVVSNSVNTITSSPSVLNVSVPPAPTISHGQSDSGSFAFTFSPVAGLTNAVQTNASLSAAGWGVLTNIPPPANSNPLTITNVISGLQRYYRVLFVP